MRTSFRTDITIADICKGFVYNELEGKGLYGLSGKLTIQPEYQHNYIYADGVFQDIRPEMCGLDWGRLYETYHNTPYNPSAVNERVHVLFGDEFVSDRKGIFEHILGGEQNKNLLNDGN